MVDVPSRGIHEVETVNPTRAAQRDHKKNYRTAIELGEEWKRL